MGGWVPGLEKEEVASCKMEIRDHHNIHRHRGIARRGVWHLHRIHDEIMGICGVLVGTWRMGETSRGRQGQKAQVTAPHVINSLFVSADKSES